MKLYHRHFKNLASREATLFVYFQPVKPVKTKTSKCLDSKVEVLYCIDEIDETCGTRKWTKTASDQLKKLNKDCNLTAGLEAELTIAIGARVMLRRNLDTKKGLVNGAIGTVTAITSQKVMVKFDCIQLVYTSNLLCKLSTFIDLVCLLTFIYTNQQGLHSS